MFFIIEAVFLFQVSIYPIIVLLLGDEADAMMIRAFREYLVAIEMSLLFCFVDVRRRSTLDPSSLSNPRH